MSIDAVVDRGKRLAPAALGGLLVAFGLRRRSLGGAAAALAGGWLWYREISERRGRSGALGPNAATDRGAGAGGGATGPTTIERSITIGKPADELYRFWHDPERMARVLDHFAEVRETDEEHQRWTVHGPLGRDVSWDVRIVEDRPDELLRWESTGDAAVPNEGSISFRPAPGDRGTEVTLRFRFDPPGGALGDAAATLLDAVPGGIVGTALRRFKSLVEAGEIPTLEGNPSGRGRGDAV